MFAVLKQRNFALLWTGGLISMIGNWVLMATLPFHVYTLTGSALATSGILMAYIAPGIFFGSIAGVFADRWDRKRIMFAMSLTQAGVVACLLFVQSVEWIWLIYVVTFIESSLGNFFGPAENALLPSLVGEEHLVAANSMNALNDNLARLVGPAIGGALLGVVGFASVAMLDAVTYLIAALMILMVKTSVKIQADDNERENQTTFSGTKMWKDWAAGLRYIRGRNVLAGMFLVAGIALFGDAILSAILVVFIQNDMGLNAVQFGWMMTARGLGGIIGGLLIAQVSRKLTTTQLASGGLAVSGLLIFIMVVFPKLTVVLPLLVFAGISVIAWIVSLQTIFQTETEDAYRGRVFGAFGTTNTLLMFVGSALAGAFADLVGTIPLMYIAAGIYAIAGIFAWKVLRQPIVQKVGAAQQAPIP